MNFYVLLFLSYLFSAKSSEVDHSSIISRINEDLKCSLSNSNFTDALHLNELCTQPLVSAEEYKSRLHYSRHALLCAEYFSINSNICNMTKLGNNVKNISVPSDKSGVNDFLNKLRDQYPSIKEFCSVTRTNAPKFSSFITSNLKDIDDYFKQIVANESTCIGVCKDILDDRVSDLCNVIIWAQLKLHDAGLTEDDKGSIKLPTDESFIEKIPPVNNVLPDFQSNNHKLANSKESENNLIAPFQENSEKPSLGSNAELSQNPEKVNMSPSIAQYTEDNAKGSENVNSGANLSPDSEQTLHAYARSNNTDFSDHPQLVTQPDKKQEIHETNKNNKKPEFGTLDAGVDIVDDDDEGGLGRADKMNGQNFQLDGNDNVSGQDATHLDQETVENKKSDNDDLLEDNLMSSLKQVHDPDLINERASYQSAFRGMNNEDSHFFAYFVSMGIVCGVLYILFHNKKKILALAVEGRRGRPHGGGRRRPNTAAYSKLDSNLEEAMVSNVSQASVTHVLY